MGRLAALLLTVLAASRPSPPDNDPCGPDVERFCKKLARPGEGRYRCLKRHEKDLSDQCKKHLSEVRGKLRKL